MTNARPLPAVIGMLSLVAFVLAACANDGESSPMSWNQLRNATYPSQVSPGTELVLVNGVVEAPAGSGTRLVARLADIGAFGEIDRAGTTDSAVFLVESAGEGSAITSLVAVLNNDGEPLIQQPFPLGENVAVVGVTIHDGEITTRVRALNGYDSSAGTIDEITRTSKLDGDALKIEDESTQKVALPSPEDFTYEPTVLEPSSGERTLDLTVAPRRGDAFVLHASAGQQLALSTSSDFDSAILSIQGLSDETTLVDQCQLVPPAVRGGNALERAQAALDVGTSAGRRIGAPVCPSPSQQ